MIIKNRNINYTDSSGQEKFAKGLNIFNILATEEDVNNYVGKQIDAHWHDQFEFFVLDKGKAVVFVDGRDYVLDEKDACYIGPGSLHGVKTVKGYPCQYRSYVVHPNVIGGGTGSIFELKINSTLKDLGNYLHIENREQNSCFFKNFDESWKTMLEEPDDYEFAVRNYLSNIFLFLKNMENSKWKNSDSYIPVLKEMMKWIDDRLEDTILVEDIARAVHLSKREAQRIFKHGLGYSPMEYVRRKKILKSADELIYTDIPIIDLAYKYGFASPAHYTVTFKKIINEKPNDYRKMNRKK